MHAFVLAGRFEPKREDVTVEWRKVNKEELQVMT
jgi:hypothetical protein